jgi:tRNA-splicing ligase RtcB (3'-phosphate/5'-hydroxy nucleic acid ligase)
MVELRRIDASRVEIPRHGAMRVPGMIFASEELLGDSADETAAQVADVATLPGIVDASYAMPDLHLGYGFPIGGVAATHVDEGGVVSPGGVGFDISCGVRVLVAELTSDELADDDFTTLMDELSRRIPRGTGPGGIWEPSDGDLRRVLVDGAAFAAGQGYGDEDDLARTEDHGRLDAADPDQVGERAVKRGRRQLGSLGGGNHFLEVQAVDEVIDDGIAHAWGLAPGVVTVQIHCGSRGLGHQVCTDHVKVMQQAMRRYDIDVPDRQLACAPVASGEGRAYLAGMAASANFARANRQVLAQATRDAFDAAIGTRALRLLYDVSHNMAKLEEHGGRTLCVHRKGATLALPPGHPALADDFAGTGQPVAVPGSMGTSSWLLAGLGTVAFSSTCHGAGRAKSRSGAKKTWRGEELRRDLEGRGIAIRALSDPGLAEEAPGAYKDVDEVVRVCEEVGLSRRVARLRPLGVVKG